jgi:hypothetical protein
MLMVFRQNLHSVEPGDDKDPVAGAIEISRPSAIGVLTCLTGLSARRAGSVAMLMATVPNTQGAQGATPNKKPRVSAG